MWNGLCIYVTHNDHVIVIRPQVQQDVKMYRVEVDSAINLIISLFYKMGLWHRGNEATRKETKLKLFYSIYHLNFLVSLIAGAFTCDDREESIFLAETAIEVVVLSMKLFYIIWRKDEILQLLNKICVYTTPDLESFTTVTEKLKEFVKFLSIFIFVSFTAGISASLILPFIGTETKLFIRIGFPLDLKNSKIAFWIAFVFLSAGIALSAITILFSVLMWYFMFTCALRYGVLGRQITTMGDSNQRKLSVVETNNLFDQDLIAAMESHENTKELLQFTTD